MASDFGLGFIKGFAGYGAKTISDEADRRAAADEDIRKAKLLEELRQQQADIEYNRSLGEIDHSLTENDYEAGTTTYKNKRGQVISTEPMDAAEKQKYADQRQMAQLQIEGEKAKTANYGIEAQNMRSEMADRAARLGIENQRLSLERQSLQGTSNSGLHGTPYGGDPDQAAAGKLMDLYKDEIHSLQGSYLGNDPQNPMGGTKVRLPGYLDTIAIRQAALDIVKNSRTGAEADQKFNEFLIRANRNKVGSKKGAYSLDSQN